MRNFVGTPPLLNWLCVAMENMHILTASTGLCLDNFDSHYSGHNQQIGIHEKLSKGARLSQLVAKLFVKEL